MQKIISLFQRNYGEGPRLVYDELVPGAEWVANGEGVATRKWDGTCVLIEDGRMWKRYDAKHGKTPPPGFRPAQEPDPVTGHWPGWLLVTDGPQDKWFREALANDDADASDFADGTYELVGPKVNGNPEGFALHTLLLHGHPQFPFAPRTFDELRRFFRANDMEGVVWHHPDGRMVKIKTRDFGLKRGAVKI